MDYKSGLAGTIGTFIADTAVRGIKRRLRQRNSQTMTETKNRGTWKDYSTYQQLDKKRFSAGRWAGKRERHEKLLDVSKSTVLYRHAGLNDLSITRGSSTNQNGTYWLSNHINSGSTPIGVKELPIHLLPLFSVNQGYIPQALNQECGIAHWQLQQLPTNELFWQALSGVNTDGVTGSERFEIVQNKESADGQYHYVGRKSLVDWSQVRLTFWGKKSSPTIIRVSLVKFTDDRFTPEFGATNNMTDLSVSAEIDLRARQFWLQRLKPLMTNPAARHPINSGTPKHIKFLSTQTIEIAPIDASAEVAPGDSRAHMRHITLHNVWNRVVDYSEPVYDNETFDNLNNPYICLSTRQAGIQGWPRAYEKNVYVMIESFQPSVTQSDDAGRLRSVLNTASFDCLVDVQHTCLSNEYTVAAPL